MEFQYQTFSYKGFEGSIVAVTTTKTTYINGDSEESLKLHGRVTAEGLTDVINFKANSIEQAEKEFQLSVEDYLKSF